MVSQKKRELQEKVVLMFRGARTESENKVDKENVKLVASAFISKLRKKLG